MTRTSRTKTTLNGGKIGTTVAAKRWTLTAAFFALFVATTIGFSELQAQDAPVDNSSPTALEKRFKELAGAESEQPGQTEQTTAEEAEETATEESEKNGQTTTEGNALPSGVASSSFITKFFEMLTSFFESVDAFFSCVGLIIFIMFFRRQRELFVKFFQKLLK